MLRSDLIPNNFKIIKGFITPDEAEQLAQMATDIKDILPYDNRSYLSTTKCLSNFLPFVKLLVRVLPKVESFVGSSLLPTYTYGMLYKKDDILEKHRDRAACEISLTLNLRTDIGWGIFIETPNGDAVCVDQNPGDAMLYLGCDATHWRERFHGEEHVQVFLHYVLADGSNADQFFDLNPRA